MGKAEDTWLWEASAGANPTKSPFQVWRLGVPVCGLSPPAHVDVKMVPADWAPCPCQAAATGRRGPAIPGSPVLPWGWSTPGTGKGQDRDQPTQSPMQALCGARPGAGSCLCVGGCHRAGSSSCHPPLLCPPLGLPGCPPAGGAQGEAAGGLLPTCQDSSQKAPTSLQQRQTLIPHQEPQGHYQSS